jgi:uncharacterized membrane protein
VKIRLVEYWDRLRSGYWFVPSLIVAASIAFAFGFVTLDSAVPDTLLDKIGWVYAGGAEGASAVLATIAGSMITIAGVVFSLTLLTLSLASSQFGPRLLRNFLRDLPNQIVLGTFVATFLYCVLVLRTIRHDDGFVPHLSVTFGVMLAVASIGLLIYFIHHVSTSIQVDQVVVAVYRELRETIDRLFPQKLGREAPDRPRTEFPGIPDNFERDAGIVAARRGGYVQVVDAERLLAIAVEHDCLIRLERRPGDYLHRGAPLALAWPAAGIDDGFCESINATFTSGAQRTPLQDVEFAVSQLVEIAVRALSPGVNDPFTAMSCLDRLGSGLRQMADRELPSPYRHDEDGHLRVIAFPTTFEAVLDIAFDPIRHYGRASATVLARMLGVIAAITDAATRERDRAALQRHAERVLRAARESLPEPDDRAAIEARYEALIAPMK